MYLWIDFEVINLHVGIRRTIFNIALLGERLSQRVSFLLVEPEFQKSGYVREWIPSEEYLRNNGSLNEAEELPKVIVQSLSQINSKLQVVASPMTLMRMHFSESAMQNENMYVFVPDTIPIDFTLRNSNTDWALAASHIRALEMCRNTKLRILTCSSETAELISELSLVPISKILVIDPGVYVEHFYTYRDVFPPTNQTKNDRNVLFVNILDRRKGLMRILSALKNSELNSITLIGRRRCSIEDMIEAEYVFKSSRYRYVESASNETIIHAYLNSDILIFPSFFEGYGIPCLEASYFGLPVFVSEGLPVNKDLLSKSEVKNWEEISDFNEIFRMKPTKSEIKEFRGNLHGLAKNWFLNLKSAPLSLSK